LERTPPFKYNILQPLLLAACIAVGMMTGYKLNEVNDPGLVDVYAYPEEDFREVGAIEELIRFVENRYIDTIDRNILQEDAIRAVFAHLDPYSDYLSPGEHEEYEQRMDGSFRGIGIEIQKIADTFFVRHVMPGGPASKADIRIFDKLIAVNGDTLNSASNTIEDIANMVGSRMGTSVKLLVQREKKYQLYDLTIEDIAVPTVHAELIPEIQTCYVRIDYFAKGTYREFMQVVEKNFENGKASHLILDLRNNPGGYIPEVTNILCQIFKEKDKILFTTRNRRNEIYEYKSTGKQFFDIDQVVVLIDGQSASASELVAGTIQDWDRGLVVGTQSYGKGLVQEQYNLKNGGAIRLSVEKYYLPSGRSIQKPEHLKGISRQHEQAAFEYADIISGKVNEEPAYKTLIRGREVHASSGITPDIKIGNPNNTNNDEDGLQEILTSFTFAYIAKHRKAIPVNKESLLKWQVPADAFTEFLEYTTNERGMEQIPETWNASLFSVDFKEEVGALLSKSKIKALNSNEEDAFLITAIKALKEKKAAQALK
jgi:carboxyl-terminal processing protease